MTWRDPLKCDDLEKIDIFKISIIIGILYAYTALFVIIFRYSYPLLKLKMASNLHHCRFHHFKIYNFVYFSRYRDISRSGDQHQLLWKYQLKYAHFHIKTRWTNYNLYAIKNSIEILLSATVAPLYIFNISCDTPTYRLDTLHTVYVNTSNSSKSLDEPYYDLWCS